MPRHLASGSRHPALLCILACFLGGCRPETTVVVETTPAAATVWIDEEVRGPAPQSIRIPADRKLKLRVSGTYYRDAVSVLTATDVPESGRLHVTLEREQTFSLACQSKPAGADVFLNGEYRGRTPLQIADLPAGTAEVVFRMEGRASVKHTVDLDASNPGQTVTAKLSSVTEGYYREQIKADPTDLAHYVDLAHHLMLEKRFESAMDVFRDGIRIAVRGQGKGERTRLWSEIQRVAQRQYDYGTKEDVKKAQRLLRNVLADAVKRYPDSDPVLHTSYISVLEHLGYRLQAQEAFREAWRRFPNNQWLRRLQRKGRYQVY